MPEVSKSPSFVQRLRGALTTGDFEWDFRAWIVLGVASLFAVSLLALAIHDFLVGRYLAAAVISFCPALMSLAIWLLIRHKSLDVAATILILTSVFTGILLMAASGGRAIGVYVYLPTIVLVATIVANRSISHFVGTICVLLPLGGYWLEHQDWWFPIYFDEGRMVSAAVRTSVLNCLIVLGSMYLYTRAADRMRRRLVDAQARNAQSQKLESIGTLAAGIAHEINTPIQYVSDNVAFARNSYQDMHAALEEIIGAVMRAEGEGAAKLQKTVAAAAEKADLDFINEELPNALEETTEGLSRIKSIVQAMKVYSHPGNRERSAVNLNEAIRSTLLVCRNRWKDVADMLTDLDPDLPLTECMPDEVNQVILNIVVNSADAIREQIDAGQMDMGEIRISTSVADGHVEIRIEDNGPGIPEELRSRVFDHFFTTKEVGKGTGQGLAISYDVVVNRHKGKLTCEGNEPHGARFVISLPIVESSIGEAAPVPA